MKDWKWNRDGWAVGVVSVNSGLLNAIGGPFHLYKNRALARSAANDARRDFSMKVRVVKVRITLEEIR